MTREEAEKQPWWNSLTRKEREGLTQQKRQQDGTIQEIVPKRRKFKAWKLFGWG